jgi:hypothetical protein
VAEGHDQESPAEAIGSLEGTDQPISESAKSAQPAGGSRRTVWWLAALLMLMIAGVGLSPFWARDVEPLLPWGSQPTAPTENSDALAARLAAIEKRSGSPPPDISAINSAASALARRVDQLEAARNPDQQTEAAAAATKAGLQQLEKRLNTIEANLASRAASEAARFDKLQQEVTQIGSLSSDLAERLPAIERRIGATSGADRANANLLAALLRMREAVEAARPFAAEYDAFIGLAHNQPDIIAAARPLAGLAEAGVPGNAALSERLGMLSGQIAPAAVPPAGSDFGTQTLAWLHSLVTIRRIDAASQTGQEPAMSVAQAALVRGDLSGAVSALQTVSGPKSEAVQSWLEKAQVRLTAEATLAHLQELLLARLGTPAEAPGGAPTEAPARSAQPS